MTTSPALEVTNIEKLVSFCLIGLGYPIVLTSIRQDGEPVCPEITSFSQDIDGLLGGSINKLRINLNTINLPLLDVIPAGIAGQQQIELLKTIEEMKRWSKEQFGATMDQLCDDSFKMISKLPTGFRNQAMQHVSAAIKMAMGFFISAFTPIIQALKNLREKCKEMLQTIAGYAGTAIQEIFKILRRLAGKDT